ncbi:MAG: undecaprenyl-diphosphate phosphatase [Patescibacteria group bacterium]
MSYVWALLLGLLQGLTEFLPVSSSGHLVIVQSLIPGFTQPGVLFDVVLHAGTLFAILYFFRDKIKKLTGNYLLLLLIGSIPVALFGFLFRSEVEGFFGNVKIVGIALFVTALFNFFTDKIKTSRNLDLNSNRNLPLREITLIGLLQALAIIPGISRSGATIFAGTEVGMSRKDAAEFSFLLSVPAVFGANALQFFVRQTDNNVNLGLYVLGFFASFVSGYIAIKLVMKFLQEKRFRIFAYYAVVVGLISILLL